VHGHEGSTKAWSNYDHELHARLHAVECENTGRISKSIKSKMIFAVFCYVNTLSRLMELKCLVGEHTASIDWS